MAIVLHDDFNDLGLYQAVSSRPGWEVLPYSSSTAGSIIGDGDGNAYPFQKYSGASIAGLGKDCGSNDHYMIVKPNFTKSSSYSYSILRCSILASLEGGVEETTGLYAVLFNNGPQFRRYVNGTNQQFFGGPNITVQPTDSFRFEVIGNIARAIRIEGNGTETVLIDNADISQLPPSNYAGITNKWYGYYNEVTFGNFTADNGGGGGTTPDPSSGFFSLF